jgi:membrane-bound metal-dependent hydrolase YbcI (DUF457 family)
MHSFSYLRDRPTFAPRALVRRICHDRRPMPSPIGHALAGAAIAWSLRGMPGWKPAVVCALAAALPDADLLFAQTHRTATHSIPVALLVTSIAIAVTGWVTPNRITGSTVPRHLAFACGLAWTSHIVLDWLGADASRPYGVQALWPLSDSWFFSGVDLFPGTERRQPFTSRAMLINLRAVVQEVLMMAPIAAGAWWLMRTRKTRGRSSGPDGPPRPSAAGAGTGDTSDRQGHPAAPRESPDTRRGR